MTINYLGVGAATLVAMIIGALWYSPLMFVKPWSLAQGKEYPCAPQKGAGAAIVNAAAMNLISALALSEIFAWRQVGTVEDALVTALLMAVGFVVSALVAFAAVKWLLGYIRSHRFTAFSIYRIALGIALLVLMPAGG